jgi:hypothetical protein
MIFLEISCDAMAKIFKNDNFGSTFNNAENIITEVEIIIYHIASNEMYY